MEAEAGVGPDEKADGIWWERGQWVDCVSTPLRMRSV